MRYLLLITILTTIIATNAESYESLLFKPLTANVFEPRIGTIYEACDEKLRLDIGASFDLTHFNPSENTEIRLGADFFTYTRLRSEGRFKFPVETSDYFFGVNASSRYKADEYDLLTRIRLAHISSHLVDGYAYGSVFKKTPFVYSREFVDITVAADFGLLRPYIGLNSVFSFIPDDIDVFIPQAGLDFEYELLSWLLISGGWDFKLVGIKNVSSGVNSLQTGLLFKTSDGAGVLVSGYYYSGKSMHGMFYDEIDNYFGLGFQLIFY